MEIVLYNFAKTISVIGALAQAITPAAVLALILVITLKIAQSKRL